MTPTPEPTIKKYSVGITAELQTTLTGEIQVYATSKEDAIARAQMQLDNR